MDIYVPKQKLTSYSNMSFPNIHSNNPPICYWSCLRILPLKIPVHTYPPQLLSALSNLTINPPYSASEVASSDSDLAPPRLAQSHPSISLLLPVKLSRYRPNKSSVSNPKITALSFLLRAPSTACSNPTRCILSVKSRSFVLSVASNVSCNSRMSRRTFSF